MRLRRMSELDSDLARVLAALGLSAAVGSGCGAGDGPSAGAEGGPCLEGDCLGTLLCNADDICVGPDTTGGSGDDSGDSGGTGSDSGETSAGGGVDSSDGEGGCAQGEGEPQDGNSAPEIVELTVDGSAVTSEQDDVRVTVTVSDADGLDDIVGVRIETPSGRSVTSLDQSSSDTFTGEIDWYYDIQYYEDDLLGQEVEFQLVVRDEGCNTTTAQLTLLVCEEGESACDGACTDTRSGDQNCGACGNACADNEYCDYGMCEEDYASVDLGPGLSTPSEPEPSLGPISIGPDAVPLSFGEPAPATTPADVTAFAL